MFMGKPYLAEMKTNVYMIPERVREIDGDYRVVRNLDAGQYEIHHLGQYQKTGVSLCLVLPFAELDCRTVAYVNQTSVRNRNLMREFRQMEEENEKKHFKKTQEIRERTSYEAKEILKFCNNTSHDWI